jgi:hypothetical protein
MMTGKEDYDQAIAYYREGNYKEAVRWFRKSAEQGFVEAQYNLGTMCLEGQGLVQSDNEAAMWFRKSAEQGLANAQYNLGKMYFEGRGLVQSDSEAVKWLRKASEQGFAEASYTLGLIGVIQREKEASVQNFEKACEQGLSIDLITKAVIATIPNEEIALAFVLEEIEAAQYGNEDAKKFAKDMRFLRDEYEGAMKDYSTEVDGPSGPQQTLTKLILGGLPQSSIDEKARMRIEVVKNVIKNWKFKKTTQENDDDVPFWNLN